MSNRRDFIVQAGTAVTAASLLSATAAGAASETAKDTKDPYALVATSAAACLRTGEACIAHCADELGNGNTSMAACNKRVHEMVALTRAMMTLASAKSDLSKRQAAVCADACKSCAAACLEHKAHWSHGMHLACKACYEACIECEKACRALAA